MPFILNPTKSWNNYSKRVSAGHNRVETYVVIYSWKIDDFSNNEDDDDEKSKVAKARFKPIWIRLLICLDFNFCFVNCNNGFKQKLK